MAMCKLGQVWNNSTNILIKGSDSLACISVSKAIRNFLDSGPLTANGLTAFSNKSPRWLKKSLRHVTKSSKSVHLSKYHYFYASLSGFLMFDTISRHRPLIICSTSLPAFSRTMPAKNHFRPLQWLTIFWITALLPIPAGPVIASTRRSLSRIPVTAMCISRSR